MCKEIHTLASTMLFQRQLNEHDAGESVYLRENTNDIYFFKMRF